MRLELFLSSEWQACCGCAGKGRIAVRRLPLGVQTLFLLPVIGNLGDAAEITLQIFRKSPGLCGSAAEHRPAHQEIASPMP